MHYIGAHHKNLNHDRPHYQRQECRPMTLVSGNIRFMRIFTGVLCRGVKRQWGNQKCRFSGLLDATSSAPQEMRPTLLYSIIQSLVAFPVTPKYDLTGYFALNARFEHLFLGFKNYCVKVNTDRPILQQPSCSWGTLVSGTIKLKLMRVFAGFSRKETSNDIGVARHTHVLPSHAEVYSLCA